MYCKLKICSYNCNSLRNSIDEIRSLLDENDILCLQETLIFANDPLVDQINPNFNSMVISCSRKEGIDSGRPIGGLIILWRKTLNAFVFPVRYQNEFCRIDIKTKYETYSLFNVYLPTDK